MTCHIRFYFRRIIHFFDVNKVQNYISTLKTYKICMQHLFLLKYTKHLIYKLNCHFVSSSAVIIMMGNTMCVFRGLLGD